jgi:hypothetical protein
MTVGQQATVASINQTLTSLSLSLRNDCQAIQNFSEFINGLGAAGLEALQPTGFSAADAAAVITMTSYLNTCALVFLGLQGQAPNGQTAANFNFSNALAPLSAGQ